LATPPTYSASAPIPALFHNPPTRCRCSIGSRVPVTATNHDCDTGSPGIEHCDTGRPFAICFVLRVTSALAPLLFPLSAHHPADQYGRSSASLRPTRAVRHDHCVSRDISVLLPTCVPWAGSARVSYVLPVRSHQRAFLAVAVLFGGALLACAERGQYIARYEHCLPYNTQTRGFSPTAAAGCPSRSTR